MTETVSIQVRGPLGVGSVVGDLTVPPGATGVVVFAHGSGSSRWSPRNRAVAMVLQEGGLATLLLDLLTSDEEEVDDRTAEFRFDIPLLAQRLERAVDAVAERPDIRELPVGLFGASTGAAAAIVAAAARPDEVSAVVSRGGRPDLAGEALGELRAATLLIVGGRDTEVVRLNREAAERMTGALHEITVVPGATHLFEEPGALRLVARLAEGWFRDRLMSPRRSG